MRPRSSACLGLLIGPILFAAGPPAHAGAFEDGVLAELNRVRAHPQAYARELRHAQVAPSRYDGQADDIEPAIAQADPDAVEDAIDYLMHQSPAPALAPDGRLAAAAREHAVRQAQTGEVGHGAPGSLAARLQGQGLYAGLEAESISYGQQTPRDVVRQLIIDSGVPSRGHRKDLLAHGFQAAGVGCGRHAEWGSMCVIDLAGAIVRR